MSAKKDQKQPASSADTGELQKALAECGALKQELEKMKDLAARAQADLQNAKDRFDRDAAELRKFAAEALILRLLPTIDNFQRAFAHLPEDLKNHEWIKGVQAVGQELLRQLEAVGLRRMQSLRQPVDTMKHEVLQSGPGEEGKVVEVFEEGYELHGKVLRPAKVKTGAGDTTDTI